MRRRPLSASAAIFALCLLPPTPGARAQDAVPPPAAPAVSAPTLAQALAQAEPPRGEVYLAVAAEKTMLPKEAPPPSPGLTVPQIADAFGRVTQVFETAGAVAPPTMTVLNTDPGTPNPYDGMPPADALKLLLGGLDNGQWALLTGDSGLGYTDLTGRSQQDLFMALFPDNDLIAQPQDDYDPRRRIMLTADDLHQARLRLSQQVSMLLQVAGQPNSHSGNGVGPSGGKPRYTATQDYAPKTEDTLYGVQVRATAPNAPKPSDLDLDAPALRVPVTLDGIKTVGDLVGRIGTTTKTELYADRRYEGRSVTLVGPASARAGDLLRALALCVCGAYRKVGPAYVLTDDVLGLGRRKMILSRFMQEADMMRAGAVADAGDKLVGHGGALSLPPTEAGLGVTDTQKAQQMSGWDAFNSSPNLEVPFNQLTPQQQEMARREFQKFQDDWKAAPTASNAFEQVTLDGSILLQPQPVLQLLSAAVPGPVTLSQNGSIGNGQIFQPSAKLERQRDEQRQAQIQKHWEQQRLTQKTEAAHPTPPVPQEPSLAALLAPLPRRAVFARPRTAPDVDALIASMRRIGLNQLWLDVFSQGKSRLDAKPSDGTPDILAEALAKTRGTGIAVIPALDLLDWGADAPEAARDLTVLGETSAQAADYQQRYQAVTGQGMTAAEADAQPPSKTLSVCPTVPAVAEALVALVQRLAATPGVAALAVRGTATPGYDRAPESGFGSDGSDLGYTPSLRLACLRRQHVDPVDLNVSTAERVNEATALPDFEDAPDTWQAMQKVGKQWNALRAGADLALMRQLLSVAQTSAGRRLPFLVKQRGMSWISDWWGLWDDPRAPLPAMTQQAIQGGGFNDSLAPFAHAQCRVDVYALASWAVQSSWTLASSLQQMKPGWDGVVIDAGFVETGDPLAALAESLTPAAAPAKKP